MIATPRGRLLWDGRWHVISYVFSPDDNNTYRWGRLDISPRSNPLTRIFLSDRNGPTHHGHSSIRTALRLNGEVLKMSVWKRPEVWEVPW